MPGQNTRRKKKIYRKKRKTFKLKGGTYLSNNLKSKFNILHPLQQFVQKQLDDNYVVLFHPDNVPQIDYQDIYTRAFLEKFVDILNVSFEREREFSISKGYNSPEFQNDIHSIKSNIFNPSFHTYILTSSNLTPISFLYIERRNQENDYDKVWTVCTDNNYRGQGMSSKLMNHMTVEQLNNNRNRMLLEVYDDDVISRRDEDVLQRDIMAHFQKNGFQETPLDEISPEAHSGLLQPLGQSKLMVLNPNSWLQNNRNQSRNLNSNAKNTIKCCRN